MDKSERQLLEFISRLTYNIEGLSLPIKLYLSQLLTFHFSSRLSEDFIRDVENKRAANPFTSNDEIERASSEFSPDQRAWCLGVLVVLRDQAIQSNNKKLTISVNRVIDNLKILFGLDDNSIARQQEIIEREVDLFQNRKVIRIPVAVWPLVLDFILRCLLLAVFGTDGHNGANLIALNVTVITAITMLTGFLVSRRDVRYNTKLLDANGGTHQFKIESAVSVRQYTLLALFIAAGTFVSYLLPRQFHTLAFPGIIFLYFIFLRFFHVGRLNENDLIRQLENNVGGRKEYTVDQNDEEIIQLETRLNSFTSRLDAYVLESALFGALTFSGFLQIVASDLKMEALAKFATSVFDTSRGLINRNWDQFNAGLVELNTKDNLLCLVSVESLVCSAFFLAVIASRLRFSDVADRVRTSIEMAKVYNDKEEVLIHQHQPEHRNDRLQKLAEKVNEQIHTAIVALERVNPVMIYMRYFRNAGILVFFSILVSSTLFITSALGWTFIAIAVATFVYFNYSRINLSIRASFLDVRITFVRRARWFLGLALLPLLLWGILSSILPDTANDFLALGYVSAGLYIFIWLILAAHADENFGDIEDRKAIQRASRWLFVKNSLAVTILAWGIANAFKTLHLRGADEMILISLVTIAILMYFVGYYLSKIRWLGVICGWILAVVAVGILFKTFHLSGADELLWLGIVLIVILMPLVIWKRKSFHALFLRFILFSVILTTLLTSGLLFKIQLAVSHRTTNVKAIEQTIHENTVAWLTDHPEAITQSIAKCEWYIKTYGKRAGYSPVYWALVRNYRLYLDKNFGVWTVPVDARLPSLLEMANEADRMRALFNYNEIYFSPAESSVKARILMLMDRKDEATKSLDTIIHIARNEEFRKEMQKEKDEIVPSK